MPSPFVAVERVRHFSLVQKTLGPLVGITGDSSSTGTLDYRSTDSNGGW